MHFDNDFGYFGFIHVVGMVVYGFFALVALAVAVGLIILLVRFLLVATKAAQLYVARNGTADTASPVTESATSGSTEPATAPLPPTTTPTGSPSAPAATAPTTPAPARTTEATTPAAAATDRLVAATKADLAAEPKPATAPKSTPPVTPAAKKPRTPKTPPAV